MLRKAAEPRKPPTIPDAPKPHRPHMRGRSHSRGQKEGKLAPPPAVPSTPDEFAGLNDPEEIIVKVKEKIASKDRARQGNGILGGDVECEILDIEYARRQSPPSLSPVIFLLQG